MLSWVYLFIAGLFEVGWAVSIKHCDGFKLNLALLIVITSMTFSMVFMWLALKTIPMGITYAVWTGIGIVGVCSYEAFILKEPLSYSSLFFISLILVGIIGLKLSVK